MSDAPIKPEAGLLSSTELQFTRTAAGSRLAYHRSGDPSLPAVLLLHGFPASSGSFRGIIEPLSQVAHVIAPDLPGFGLSEALPQPSFGAFADCIEALLADLRIGPRVIYLHDFGAPVGLQLALRAPHLVTGLVVQNANAHEAGLGEAWEPTRAYWRTPDARHEAPATSHLSLEGTRDQYLAGIPSDLAARIDPRRWMDDWQTMNRPGNMETQRALVLDYRSHVANFPAIQDYLRRHHPPAMVLWGRHDVFFDMAEVECWTRTLPRSEAHILDAGHFVLETHASLAADLISRFVARVTNPG